MSPKVWLKNVMSLLLKVFCAEVKEEWNMIFTLRWNIDGGHVKLAYHQRVSLVVVSMSAYWYWQCDTKVVARIHLHHIHTYIICCLKWQQTTPPPRVVAVSNTAGLYPFSLESQLTTTQDKAWVYSVHNRNGSQVQLCFLRWLCAQRPTKFEIWE